ncbi:hypothetical protein ACGFZP_13000 [Kitasatospora sp. NPDC048239]|uniref:hypothetical protein n=1 Tax=Kitasatospora sp. NPDC048239 TaxID=3364046 RepID=UPI00371CA8E2
MDATHISYHLGDRTTHPGTRRTCTDCTVEDQWFRTRQAPCPQCGTPLATRDLYDGTIPAHNCQAKEQQ